MLLLGEREIKNLLKEEDRVGDFVVKNSEGDTKSWVVDYRIDYVYGNSIRVKNTGKRRVFKTLDSVANWMEKLGINRFVVVPNKD